MSNNKEIFGFGLMRLPLTNKDDPKSIDEDEFIKMVDYYMDNGYNYFDTSYAYHEGQSERAFKKAVTERYPRQSYRIIDKIPTWLLNNEEDNQKYVEEMLERLGVEYFDRLFIHNINEAWIENAIKANTFDYIKKAKEEGLAKEIGFSLHAKPEVLEKVLNKYDFFDFVQLQLNYLDWEDPQLQIKKCHQIAVEHGLKVLVMEPIKGGTLINLPEDILESLKEQDPDASAAKWALRFAASQENVDVVNSGMSSFEQMKENVDIFNNFKALSDEENEFLLSLSRKMREEIPIGCSYCKYCVETCPKEIPIPDYFAMYNSKKALNDNNADFNYMILSQKHGKASDCIECGLCVEHCTQSLDIPELMKLVKEEFESAKE